MDTTKHIKNDYTEFPIRLVTDPVLFNTIEVRKQTDEDTGKWAFYGFDSQGVEFGIVFNSRHRLKQALDKLRQQVEDLSDPIR